jgi:hypothetical protein
LPREQGRPSPSANGSSFLVALNPSPVLEKALACLLTGQERRR